MDNTNAVTELNSTDSHNKNVENPKWFVGEVLGEPGIPRQGLL